MIYSEQYLAYLYRCMGLVVFSTFLLLMFVLWRRPKDEKRQE